MGKDTELRKSEGAKEVKTTVRIIAGKQRDREQRQKEAQSVSGRDKGWITEKGGRDSAQK